MLLLRGRTDEALAEAQSTAAVQAFRIESMSAQACALAHGGNAAAAREILEALLFDRTRRFVQPYEIATIQLALGDREAAMASLIEALDIRSHRLVFLGVAPYFDALRGDPEFERLVERIGLA